MGVGRPTLNYRMATLEEKQLKLEEDLVYCEEGER